MSLLKSISALAGQTAEGRPLISVFALQHLDKEKGEALVFSGRQFPYITDLVDISEIDHDRYEILEMSKRTKALEKTFDSETGAIRVSEEQKMEDIKKEIERKFNELFD